MQRLWQVDASRGLALTFMLVSNFVTDLQYFKGYSSFGNVWFAFAQITAFMFIFIVGFSLVLSYNRAVKENKATFGKYLKRGLWIFGLGLLITFVSYLFIGADYIRWGVLSLIGTSIILTYPFLKAKPIWPAVLGLLFIIAGWIAWHMTVTTNLLLPIGFTTASFSSVDYFPLLPWFGVALLGIFFAKAFYSKISSFQTQKPKLKPLCWLGRHSLLIYLIHQPIFLALLMFI
jgi:uncharacterized membrane protein